MYGPFPLRFTSFADPLQWGSVVSFYFPQAGRLYPQNT